MDTIKCGRITYELQHGDTILDNGHSLQLITRKVGKGFHHYPPRVSRAAFKRFCKMTNIAIILDRDLTYYKYVKNDN